MSDAGGGIDKLKRYVTFAPYAAGKGPALDASRRISLTLEAAWTIKPGLESDVNVATVPEAELARLGDGFTDVGAVEFWSETAPPNVADGGGAQSAQPDFVWRGVRIVNVDAARVGFTPGGPRVDRVLTWKVYFGDARCDLAEPFGGRLTQGKVNEDPAPRTGTDGKPDPARLDNLALIDLCASAMGIDVTVDEEAIFFYGTQPPMLNLNWNGSHAPAELKRLLDYVGAIACPQSDGSLLITIPGQLGQEPAIPAGRRMTDVPLPVIDRRGKTAIFTSIPTAAVRTYTSKAEDVTFFRYVIQDKDGKWDQIAANYDGDPLVGLKEGFSTSPPGLRPIYQDQMFRCLQIVPEKFDPAFATLLRKGIGKIGGASAIEILGNKAMRQTADGLWKNADDWIAIPVVEIDQPNGVITLAHRLGRIKSDYPTGNPDGMFDNLILAKDLQVRLTFEEPDKDDEGKACRKYFCCGFTRKAGGTLQEVPEGDAVGLMRQGGKDVMIFCLPNLRQVTTDDVSNRQDLVDQCKPLAEACLAGSGLEPRLVRAVGFVQAEIDGTVCEISLNQQNGPTTEFKVDQWFRPSNALTSDLVKRLTTTGKGNGGGGSPHQAATESERVSLGGGAVGVPPVVPVSSPAAIPLKQTTIAVTLTRDGGSQGSKTTPASWTYTAQLGTQVLGRTLAPKSGRPNGSFSQATDGQGHFSLTDGSFVLDVAFELPSTTGDCPT